MANGQTGGHSGEPWWDGLVYESITGASCFLASHPDPEVKARIDGFVDRIAAAAATIPMASSIRAVRSMALASSGAIRRLPAIPSMTGTRTCSTTRAVSSRLVRNLYHATGY